MKVEKLIISKDAKYYSGKRVGKTNVPDAQCEFKDNVDCHAGKGIVGDRYYDYKENFNGQITFISYELHSELQKYMNKDIPMELYRRNVFISGKDPVELVGKKFKIGDVEFEGTEDCTPCNFMEKFIGDGALKWMKKNQSGGLRAKILSSGTIKVNDTGSF
jgi:MOSC domain-containing protein YiiM